jgi:hypothetical protein
MVAQVPARGTLVTLLGRNHAKAGMKPMHPSCKEYMEGYKKYLRTVQQPATL